MKTSALPSARRLAEAEGEDRGERASAVALRRPVVRVLDLDRGRAARLDERRDVGLPHLDTLADEADVRGASGADQQEDDHRETEGRHAANLSGTPRSAKSTRYGNSLTPSPSATYRAAEGDSTDEDVRSCSCPPARSRSLPRGAPRRRDGGRGSVSHQHLRQRQAEGRGTLLQGGSPGVEQLGEEPERRVAGRCARDRGDRPR